jgi:DNA-binding response OmpR family regulator
MPHMADVARSRPAEQRATWLVLAIDGPAIELHRLAPTKARVRTVADPDAFNELLTRDRPRIAIVAEPPARSSELDLTGRERRRRRQGLRTIHLSPAASVRQRMAALRTGFDEALPQTVDVAELAERASILDAQARSRPGARLPVSEGYEIDLVAHELRFDGASVHLRPKEFQLLATLAAHPGRAYTRRQLLDRVWGHDQVGDPRTVDVHVRWLRSKIEPRPDRPIHLVTVRGVGYRFDPPLTEP